jgi:glycosyltransferase involved in cell wall biosynthesis
MKISIVIPTYNRNKHLHNCLVSILHQTKSPYEVIVVNNAKNDEVKKILNIAERRFKKNNIKIFYIQNKENSGSAARNLGAFRAKGDLVAFLDDDVILNKNYYYEIEKVFLKNNNIMGVQGIDASRFQFHKNFKNSFTYRWIYRLMKFFQISGYYENECARVLPSLCVTHPYTGFKKLIQSQWISTCAGVFSKKVFSKFRFDSELKKYSWNEYLDFSYSIYLKYPKSLFITPFAKYSDVQTNDGRLRLKELIYMAEVYDLYIFQKIFNVTFYNISIYAWSKFGRMIFNVFKIVLHHPKNIILIFHAISAPFYALWNISKIKKCNLSFFNKNLS